MKTRTEPVPTSVTESSTPMHQSREQQDVAWSKQALADDPMAEHLGEAFVQEATSGQQSDVEESNILLDEEIGGPFVETTAAQEFAYDQDYAIATEPALFPIANAEQNEANRTVEAAYREDEERILGGRTQS